MAEREKGYCDGCGQPAGGFTEYFGMMLCDLCIADEAEECHDCGEDVCVCQPEEL